MNPPQKENTADCIGTLRKVRKRKTASDPKPAKSHGFFRAKATRCLRVSGVKGLSFPRRTCHICRAMSTAPPRTPSPKPTTT